jgi:hypothetical protein
MNQPTTPEGGIDWADTWEHPPEHGPAVFVAERRALDTTGMLLGGWVNPTSEPEILASAIEQAVGTYAADRGTWIVTDQIDLGHVMLPEELTVTALHRIASQIARGGQR